MGMLTLVSGFTVEVLGNFTNSGTVLIGDESTANSAILMLGRSPNGTTTISGGGSITLQDKTYSQLMIYTGNSPGVVVANEDNLIQGTGFIGSYNFGNYTPGTFSNSGVISANVSGQSLSLINASYINTGTMQATSGGTLAIRSPLDNSNGVLFADSSSIVDLISGAAVTGGKLTGAGTYLGDRGSLINVTNAATISVALDSGLQVVKSLTNTGAISVGGSASSGVASLYFDWDRSNPVITLSGGGTITLQNQTYSQIFVDTGNSPGIVVLNQDNLIQGVN
jgi:hypothetical protein